MDRVLIFAYGSNMNPEDVSNWLKGSDYDPQRISKLIENLIKSAKVGVLEGYELVWNYYSSTRGGGAVNIQERVRKEVWGVTYEADEEWQGIFDKKEGYPNFYRRIKARVKLKNGELVECFAYKVRKEKESSSLDVWPTEEYRNIIIQGAKRWGLPGEYIRMLESLFTQSEPRRC